MSLTALRSVFGNPEPRGPSRSVLLCLAWHADANGNAWPSERTLAAEAGLNRKTVRRALIALADAGAIKISPKARAVRNQSAPGARKVNVYRLLCAVPSGGATQPKPRGPSGNAARPLSDPMRGPSWGGQIDIFSKDSRNPSCGADAPDEEFRRERILFPTRGGPRPVPDALLRELRGGFPGLDVTTVIRKAAAAVDRTGNPPAVQALSAYLRTCCQNAAGEADTDAKPPKADGPPEDFFKTL